MSYARWGEGSDVYVYADVYGGVACCACLLDDSVNESTYTDLLGMVHVKGEPVMFGAILRFYSADELITHFRKHIAAGHTVPDDLLDPQTYVERDYDPFERNPSRNA